MEKTPVFLYLLPMSIRLYQTEEIAGESTYEPTPKHSLQLKTMAECQKSRIILNVGGSRFETCVPTLQSDPSSILSYMVLKETPMKPYNVDNIHTYFLDRDPRHFVHISNYKCICVPVVMQTYLHFPELSLPFENYRGNVTFYNLSHLHCLLEKSIVDILQGHLQD